MEDTCGFGYWGKTSEEILKSEFPLHHACRDGNVESLSLLLVAAQHGIYAEDGFYGWTPAHWAAYFGKLNCLMKLLEHGMNCDVTTVRFNQTPGHIAAFAGHSHCLKWLLHCGSTLNKQDYLGETLIHKAARTGSMECVSLLTSHGAHLTILNHSKLNPGQLARSCGFKDCADYLDRAVQYQQERTPPAHEAENMKQVEKCGIFRGLNGGLIPNAYRNGSGDAPMGDDEMDMDHVEDQSLVLNGVCATGIGNGLSENGFSNTKLATNGFTNGHVRHGDNGHSDDVLLNKGVSHNCVPVAGRKRCREDIEDDGPKRMRREEFVESDIDVVQIPDTPNINPKYNTDMESECYMRYDQLPARCQAQLAGHYI